jgi:hypothetical protein
VSGTVTFYPDALMARFTRKLVSRFEGVLEEIEETARSRAPQRRPESGKGPFKAKVRRQNFRPATATSIPVRTPRGTVHRIPTTGTLLSDRKTQVQGGSFLIGFELTSPRASSRDRAEVAKGNVTLHFAQRRKDAAGNPIESKTQSKGLRVSIGGHLKASIHRLPVVVQGTAVKGTVRAEADYAWYVHQGFDHTGQGGKHIQGRPFLSSALAQVKDRLRER